MNRTDLSDIIALIVAGCVSFGSIMAGIASFKYVFGG